MAQPRLKDGAGAHQMGLPARRFGRPRQVKIVLGERDDQLGVIAQACAFDRLAGAKAAGGITAQRRKPVGRDCRS